MTFTVADLIAEFLDRMDIETAFGIVSVHNIPMLDAISRRNRMRVVTPRGEAGAAHMADGYARATGKLGLSLRQLTENPWTKLAEKYAVGAIVSGRVVRATEFGAFVELEPGVEGLVHVSEISWSRRAQSPKRMFHKGQEVEVQVLGVDTVEKRISLGMKQFQENPWATVDLRYPIGTKIHGRVRNMFVLPGGDRKWPLIGSREYYSQFGIRQYKVVQTALHELEVQIVSPPLGTREAELIALVKQWIDSPVEVSMPMKPIRAPLVTPLP